MKNFIEVHVITHENAPTTKVLINVSSIFIVESLFNNAITGIQCRQVTKRMVLNRLTIILVRVMRKS